MPPVAAAHFDRPRRVPIGQTRKEYSVSDPRLPGAGIDPAAGPGQRLDAVTRFSSRPGALDDLRGHVRELITMLSEHPEPSWELDEAQWRADELAEELAKPEPSAPRIKSRWMRLAPLLRELRPDISIRTVNDLIGEAL
jgi:hypothetical protein